MADGWAKGVASEARAAVILRDIAERYGLDLRHALCARWDRACMAARSEMAWALNQPAPMGLSWSTRRIGLMLGCSHVNVRKLLSYHQISQRVVQRMMPAAEAKAMLEIERDELVQRARRAEADLLRLSGGQLAERLHFELPGLKLRGAIVLATLIEAYPRFVRAPAMQERYDLACEELRYGQHRGATDTLIGANATHANQVIVALGGPAHAIAWGGGDRGARQISADAACWLADRVGAPAVAVVRKLRPAALVMGA